MKTKAAVITEIGKGFEIMELDLDDPKKGEVLVKWSYAGLCHSDLHLETGDFPARLPIVAGHEGSGVVEAVGEGVSDFAPGDHVVGSFIPTCGKCRACANGYSNLCDGGLNGTTGMMSDGTFRWHLSNGEDAGGMCSLGTFSERSVVSENSLIKIQDWIPLDVAALVGCGVTTGWGSAVYTADVNAGDTVVIFGVGGIGINAIQGAKHAGARYIIAVDTDEQKLEYAKQFGATHTFTDAGQATGEIYGLTWGDGAEKAIITIGVADSAVTEAAFNAVGKRGTVVLVSMGALDNYSVNVPGLMLCQFEKTIKGSLFGSANARYDIENILRLWDQKHIKLEELITNRYTLDEVQQGYQDQMDGKLLRGIVVHDS